MKTICKEMKKILCCFVMMCAVYAASGIFGVTSTYAYEENGIEYNEQATIGEYKEVTAYSKKYMFKIVPNKTGVYKFTQSNQSYRATLRFLNTKLDEIKYQAAETNNSIEFYALKGKTYYIEFYCLYDAEGNNIKNGACAAGYSITYKLSLEKEMKYVPKLSCVVSDIYTNEDLLSDGKNFKFDGKSRTLEIKNYKGIAPYIRVWDKEAKFGWNPKDVYADDCTLKVKIIGNNTIYVDKYSFSISSPIVTKFVGNGVLNVQNEKNSEAGALMHLYGMTVDGPTINLSCDINKKEKESIEGLYIKGNFEMLSGELNIDSKYIGLEIVGNTFFKGGKININVTDADRNCAIYGLEEIYFEGTDINIDVKDIKVENLNFPSSIIRGKKVKFSSGSLYAKADNYATVINTYGFNMTGGSIYADMTDYALFYGDVITSSGPVNINGGAFIIKYNTMEDLPDDVSDDGPHYAMSGSVVFDKDSDSTVKVDNTQIVLLAGNEKLQKLMEQNEMDDLKGLFIAWNGEVDASRVQIGKNVKVLFEKNIDINKLGIKLTEKSVIYDGKAKKPKLDLRGLREGIDVEVTYSNNVNIGEGKVIVKGKGDFAGTVSLKFSIKEKKENVSKKDNTKNNSINSIFNDGKYIYKIVKPAGKKYGKVSVIGLKKKSLKKINIKASVKHAGLTYKITSIGANAFKNKKKITRVKIGKNVTKIGKKAFYKCKKLKKVVIKSVKLKKVGKKAYAKTSKKLVIKVASKKKKTYFKKLKKAGFKGKIK